MTARKDPRDLMTGAQKQQAAKRNRRKGYDGENELAAKLTAGLGVPVYRQLGQARDGGPDLMVRLPMRSYAIEVKRVNRFPAPSRYRDWVDQARAGAVGQRAVLAYRVDGRHDWHVTFCDVDVLGVETDCQVTLDAAIAIMRWDGGVDDE